MSKPHEEDSWFSFVNPRIIRDFKAPDIMVLVTLPKAKEPGNVQIGGCDGVQDLFDFRKRVILTSERLHVPIHIMNENEISDMRD